MMSMPAPTARRVARVDSFFIRFLSLATRVVRAARPARLAHHALIALTVLLVLTAAHARGEDPAAPLLEDWPHWRGPLANGVAPHADPPLEWSESHNVRWKVAVPGRGTATPIILGDRIFLLTAIETEGSSAPAAGGDNAADGSAEAASDPPRGGRSREGAGERSRDGAGNRPRDGAGERSRDGAGDRSREGAGDRPREGAGDRPRRPGRPPGGAGEGAAGGRGAGGAGGRPGGGSSRAYEFVVLAIDRRTGRTLWQQVAREEVPHEGHHRDHGYASASPTTDGRYLYASFGSRGVYCYDLDGQLQWEQHLGQMQTRNSFGEGASPAIYGDALVVPWDHEGPSFLAVLDARTGAVRWKVERDESTQWATPLVIEHEGRVQVITNGTNRVRSYDLATGELLWECGGQTASAIPSPVAREGVVYCMSGFRGKAIYAIPLSASGDVTHGDAILWRSDRGTPYVPSPLLYGDLLYFFDGNRAVLSVVDAPTGNVLVDRQRVPRMENVYASPVGAADRVYLVARDGTTVVLAHGGELEVLATNALDDPIDASPAAVGRELFLRGEKYLYCLSEESGGS